MEMQIETREQLNRTVQALNETYATIERMKSPKRTSRTDAEKIVAELEAHAQKLNQMIAKWGDGVAECPDWKDI